MNCCQWICTLGLYLWVNTSVACPCFNSGYLHHIFSSNKNLRCQVVINGHNNIFSVQITDGVEEAYTTFDNCYFKADHHTIIRRFHHHSDHHTNCIPQVLGVCTSLGATMNRVHVGKI